MSQQTTIRKLAALVNTPVEKLQEQLAEAGMEFSDPDQVVTSTEKVKLLGFLRRTHGTGAQSSDTAAAPKKITLNRSRKQELTVGGGRNRQTVDVVVRKKVTLVKPTEQQTAAAAAAVAAAGGDDERAEILRKLEESRQQNLQEQQRLAEEDRRRVEEAERKRQEEAAEVERARKEAEEAAAPPPAEEEEAPVRKPVHGKPAPAREERGSQRPKTARAAHTKGRGGEKEEGGARFAGQLHLSADDRARRSTARKGRPRRQVGQARSGAGPHGFERPTAPVVREVEVGDAITVAELAQKLAMKGGDVVKTLFKMGVMATINQTIDHDTAVLVTEELGHVAVRAGLDDAESELLAHVGEVHGEAVARPPVVTIMGHVDHGKTSLLDHIRSTRIATGEAGGITQHIGAYHVETDKGVVSFLDTPGHAAFSSMRARGAKLTDIVVIVVAADDGVMPQTVEAIQHARAAEVPLIIAINKIDKSTADPSRIKNELLEHEVVSEEFGGDIQMVEISAKTGLGIDDLLDAILLQAELLELTAVGEGRATGTVIESSLDKGRGPVATVLVQQGQLGVGDFLVCGVHFGRVRALFDETGQNVESAGPSIPVQLLGLSGVPDAGDDFVVVEDERLAREVAQEREQRQRESRLVQTAGSRMEDIMAQMGQAEQLQLNLVIKADVQGSVEALKQALTALSNEHIRINIIVSGVGGINESDANAAATAKATIIGFNVRADASARKVIETSNLDLRYFSIIYDVIDQVKQVASGILGVEIREEIIGTAEVREVFRSSRFGAVAGSMVVEGVVRRNKPIRVLRDDTVIFEGELESLRRFKEDVDEVRENTECGIGVKAYNDVQPGDKIECFERIEVQRTL